MGSNCRVIVQASSRAWSGGQDLCMRLVDGVPVVSWTIQHVLDLMPSSEVVVAAPAFDRGGALDAVVGAFPSSKVSIFYGHDASPLRRLVAVCGDLADSDHVLRLDGLHFCCDLEAASVMLDTAKRNNLDCMKLPDDFPVHFGTDVYGVGALRRAEEEMPPETRAVFSVHPKFFLFHRNCTFRCAFFEDVPAYEDEFLRRCRRFAEPIYAIPRQEVSAHRIWSGDRLSYHYELALHYLHPAMRVLDIACGDGFGVRMMAERMQDVHGADLDGQTIEQARRHALTGNTTFHVEDVTQMTFGNESFDAITSMETFEHVEPLAYLKEIRRVLKTGGRFIVSTPQNSRGAIPVNSCHLREFSLKEAMDLCGRHFRIEHVVGFKAGIITFPENPLGTNTFLVCVKE